MYACTALEFGIFLDSWNLFCKKNNASVLKISQMTVVRVKEHCLYFIKIENQNENSSGCKQKSTKCGSKDEKHFQQKWKSSADVLTGSSETLKRCSMNKTVWDTWRFCPGVQICYADELFQTVQFMNNREALSSICSSYGTRFTNLAKRAATIPSDFK